MHGRFPQCLKQEHSNLSFPPSRHVFSIIDDNGQWPVVDTPVSLPRTLVEFLSPTRQHTPSRGQRPQGRNSPREHPIQRAPPPRRSAAPTPIEADGRAPTSL